MNILECIKHKKEEFNKDEIFEILFYVGFTVFVFLRVIWGSELILVVGKTKSLLRILSFVLLLPKVLFTKYEKRDYFMIAILYAITIICICAENEKNLIIYPTIFIGLKNVDIKKIIRIIFYVILATLVIHFIFFTIEYCKNDSFITMFHLSSLPVKNKILFMQNNSYAFRFACCIMQYIYLTDRNNKRYIKFISLILIDIFMLLLTQSRASFIVAAMAIFFLILEKNTRIINILPAIKNLTAIFAITFSYFLIFVGKMQNLDVFQKINSYLSGRPYLFANSVDYVGINLLPNVEKFNNLSKHFGYYAFPDNSYICTLLKWGILILVFFIVLSYFLTTYSKKDSIITYYVIIMLFWFIVEGLSTEFIICFVPLLLFNNYFNNAI